MNYMKEIATLLNVGLGEQFNIKDSDGNTDDVAYWIDSEGLKSEHCTLPHHGFLFQQIINGKCEVIKLPYRPKRREGYWACSITSGIICRYIWDDDFIDFLNLYIGNVYRTKQEAEQAQQKIFNQIGYQQK